MAFNDLSKQRVRRKYDFITEPSDALKCMICLELAMDPMQHDKCGKLFCMACIEHPREEKELSELPRHITKLL